MIGWLGVGLSGWLGLRGNGSIEKRQEAKHSWVKRNISSLSLANAAAASAAAAGNEDHA